MSRSGPKNSTQIYHEVSTPLRRKNDLECNSSFQTCFNNTWDPARLWLVLAFAGAPRTLSSESGSISPVRRVRRKRRGIKKAAKTSTFGFQHFLYVQVLSPPLLRGLRPGDRNKPPMNNKYIYSSRSTLSRLGNPEGLLAPKIIACCSLVECRYTRDTSHAMLQVKRKLMRSTFT